MILLATMVTRMEIKTMIFHMTNSITILPFENMLWLCNRSKWRWIILKEPNNMKLDGLGIAKNMKGNILFISKTSFIHVAKNFFPMSNNGLGKCRTSLIIYNLINFYTCCITEWLGIIILFTWSCTIKLLRIIILCIKHIFH